MQIKNTGRGKDLKYLSGRLTKQYESRLIAIIHRKGREERKAEEQKSLRPLRLINFHGIPTAQGNKEKVIFQTGFIGSTGCVISFNQVHPVIMEDNFK